MKLDVYKKLNKKWSFEVGACLESCVHKYKENPDKKREDN